MKIKSHLFFTCCIVFSVLFTSCRKEEIEFQQAPEEETLQANSNIAYLMQRTAMNDGSVDNIIDNSNCFTVQLPVTVVANGLEITINSLDDLNSIEGVFDEFDDDTDELEINFPITIIFNDFTSTIITDSNQLYSYSVNCNGENEPDDDIECVDFDYPMSASIFNANEELLYSVTLTSDYQLYTFIDSIDMSDFVTVDFPITVSLFDGTQLIISNLNELEITIENYVDACDEDDDNDYSDDDCDTCTPLEFTNILTQCTDWSVDKLKRNDNDYEDYYIGYTFNFMADGSLISQYLGNTYPGTWTTDGAGNNITVTINIPSLPYCNSDYWILHEIETYSGETKIDLRDSDDRFRLESNCN